MWAAAVGGLSRWAVDMDGGCRGQRNGSLTGRRSEAAQNNSSSGPSSHARHAAMEIRTRSAVVAVMRHAGEPMESFSSWQVQAEAGGWPSPGRVRRVLEICQTTAVLSGGHWSRLPSTRAAGARGVPSIHLDRAGVLAGFDGIWLGLAGFGWVWLGCPSSPPSVYAFILPGARRYLS